MDRAGGQLKAKRSFFVRGRIIVSECVAFVTVSGRMQRQLTHAQPARCATHAPIALQTRSSSVDTCTMDQPHRSTSLPKPQVVVRAEEEVDGGWLYQLDVTTNAATTHHTVLLGWRDHDYWSGGTVAPSRVVTSLIEYALARVTGDLPAHFDAGRVRRMVPQVDQELRWAM
jgi:hypothetical protein